MNNKFKQNDTFNMLHEVTGSGVNAIRFSFKNSIGLYSKVVLFNKDGNVIALFDNYNTHQSDTEHKIENTQVGQFLNEIKLEIEQYSCLFNLKENSLFSKIILGSKIQAHQNIFHYNNPIHSIIEKMDMAHIRLWRELFDAKTVIGNLKVANSKLSIKLADQKKYGTDSESKIAKILKAEKAKQDKEFKQKVLIKIAFLKDAIKNGDKYVAVLMDYKKRKFNGYTIETRYDKPKCKVYFNLNKDSIKEIAETLIKNYE